ncbi:MAG: helix-turn-helix domain-containing protein [Chlamydiae bacterium]|nr:helix-turn-helix domain-containing protein [Chlamydiota bacterium]
MPVRTRTRRIRRLRLRSFTKEKNISWREAAKRDIRKHSEGGQMVRGARFKADVSQRELARAIGVNQHHISEMENGKRPIGKEMAKRLAEFFKMDYRLFL